MSKKHQDCQADSPETSSPLSKSPMTPDQTAKRKIGRWPEMLVTICNNPQKPFRNSKRRYVAPKQVAISQVTKSIEIIWLFLLRAGGNKQTNPWSHRVQRLKWSAMPTHSHEVNLTCSMPLCLLDLVKKSRLSPSTNTLKASDPGPLFSAEHISQSAGAWGEVSQSLHPPPPWCAVTPAVPVLLGPRPRSQKITLCSTRSS